MDCEGSQPKRQRTAKDSQLEKAMIDWFNQEGSEGNTIGANRARPSKGLPRTYTRRWCRRVRGQQRLDR
ncbi:hypothetical protein DPMN_120662 [Dreissena polymorpha]|uniref:Uncharacterized protein n=1 Tax=Dreissena polymorpha TaxID=45954 RepID=A0A9D4GKN1_DREPO|nr:hypothetical protein DPMN_120662 [Dreissena polymorpha]